jgi:hypothetical protein
MPATKAQAQAGKRLPCLTLSAWDLIVLIGSRQSLCIEVLRKKQPKGTENLQLSFEAAPG